MCNISNELQDKIRKCSGEVGIGTKLFSYWLENDCPTIYFQAINTTNGDFKYNPNCQLLVQENVFNLFQNYLTTNKITDNVISPDFNNFQNTLLDLCIDKRLPGVCTKFLESFCSNFTREQVNNSPILINFCGCYTPPDPNYLKYTLGTKGCLDGSNCKICTDKDSNCVPQPACDPLCNRALTSQRVHQPTGNFITCSQNICVIDDVTISIIGSETGNINFNSVCSNCDKNGCLCIISGVNISNTMSKIGVGDDFNQFCGPNSVCLVKDSNGNIISQEECKNVGSINISVPTFFHLNIGLVIIIASVLIISLIILIFSKFTI